jgi:hypothetical protein
MAVIENAVYANADNTTVNCDYDGEKVSVPVTLDNRHYAEIVRQEIVISAYEG